MFIDDNEIVPDTAHRPTHVGRQQVEDFFCRRGEAADGQVSREHQDGHVDAGVQIAQVGIEATKLGVAMGPLLIEGGQLFVGRLQLFLGSFQFFVDALEFLIGGLDFFVRRLEFLVGGFVLFLDGLQVIACVGKLGFECLDSMGFFLFC